MSSTHPRHTAAPRSLLTAVLIAAAALSSLVVATPVSAQEPAVPAECDAVLLDDAGALTPDGEARVVAAAEALAEEHRAVVRVRVEDTIEAGSPEAYVAHQQQRCESWRSPSGDRHRRLLVVVVALGDRRTGIQYGGALSSLSGVEARIQADVMNPSFAAGDVADGLADGLDALTAALSDPASGGPSADTERSGVSSGDTGSGGLSLPSGAAAMWSLVVVLAALVLYWALLWLRRHLAARSARAAKRAALIAQRTTLSEALMSLMDDWRGDAFDVAALRWTGDDGVWAATESERLTALVDVTIAALADIDSADTIAAADDERLARIEVAITELAARGASTAAGIDKFMDRVAEIKALAPAWAERSRALHTLVDDATAAVTVVRDRNLGPTGAEDLAEAAASLAEADRAAAEGSWVRADDAADRGQVLAERSLQAATELTDAHSAWPARLAEAKDALGAAAREVGEGDRILDELEGTWAPSALEVFRGPLRDAAGLVEAATATLVAADSAPFSLEATTAALFEAQSAVSAAAAAASTADGAPADLTRRLEEADAQARSARSHLQQAGSDARARSSWDAWERGRAGGLLDPFALHVLAVTAQRDASEAVRAAAEAARAAARAAEDSYSSGSSSFWGAGGGGGGGGSSSSWGGGSSGGGSSSSW